MAKCMVSGIGQQTRSILIQVIKNEKHLTIGFLCWENSSIKVQHEHFIANRRGYYYTCDEKSNRIRV